MKKALEELKSMRLAANETIGGDPRTRPGREMARRQAREKLPDAEASFRKEFSKVGFSVFLNGTRDGVKSFADIAAKEAEVVFLDFRDATRELRTAVQNSLGKNREFSPGCFTVMLREIRQVAADMGLTSIPDIKYEGSAYLPDQESVDALVDQYLMNYLGAEFIALVVERGVSRQAETLTGESSVVPVLLTGITQNLHSKVGGLLNGGRSLETDVPEDVSEEDVLATFKAIKYNLSPSPKAGNGTGDAAVIVGATGPRKPRGAQKKKSEEQSEEQSEET